MRYAVKAAYDGGRFHGSQRQEGSGLDTVEGSILAALEKVGEFKWDKRTIAFSSRTDAGVSALGNVFSIFTDGDIVDLLRALNANMEDIWCLAYGTMRESQNIRWATSRWYRYHLPPDCITPEQIPLLNEALGDLVGSFDFRHLCKAEEGKNTTTLVERASAADMTGTGEMVAVDVVGSRFLWQQVRRMVGASLMIAKGEMKKEEITDLLTGEELSEGSRKIRDRIPTMPPTGLVLMNVDFKDIEFMIEPSIMESRYKRIIEGTWKSTMQVVLYSALRSIRSHSFMAREDNTG